MATKTYDPPTGVPPRPSQPTDDLHDHDIPDDAPPAYSQVASGQGDTVVQAGPSRMDFSGPPPMPDRLTQNITGVGVGYEPRHQNQGYTGQSHNPFSDAHSPVSASHTGQGGFAPPSGPPPLPHRPSSGVNGGTSSPAPNHGQSHGQGQGQDLSPTEVPTNGRPLLRKGQLLVYPKNHLCKDCGNTGYKQNDPSNPCKSDWRKYGKAYSGALAVSYRTATGPNANPSTSASSNFQRPLPNHAPPQHHQQHSQHQPHQHHQHHQQHHPPPPNPHAWGTYPGQPFRPPPPPTQPHVMPVQHGAYMSHGYGMPQAPLVVNPGDPRIGGRFCHRCSGSGRELTFLGFDDGPCWHCHGVGRVF